MKKIFTIATLALLASCNSSKGISSTNWLGKQITIINECPSKGTCTATRTIGSGIQHSGESEVSFQIIDNKETILIHYEFNKAKADGNYADDFHKEEIFLEIPANVFKKEYKDEELEDVKLVFGRHCYCKGSAGYFKITEGNLFIDNKDSKTKVKLSFKAPVPQLYENIEFVVE